MGAFAQEDGTISKEESTGNNERIGQYSYIDDTGKTITVKYSAGINGFRILEGDHIPSGGQKSANADNLNEVGEPKEYEYEYYDDTVPESPFVNPFDSSPHRARCPHHRASQEVLPPRPDQAGQVPPGI